jgi:hypothetical protein
MMKTRADYLALVAELNAIGRANGDAYLSDMCVDQENIDPKLTDESSDEYWNAMYNTACSSAGMRAEEFGLDINALIGRIIY